MEKLPIISYANNFMFYHYQIRKFGVTKWCILVDLLTKHQFVSSQIKLKIKTFFLYIPILKKKKSWLPTEISVSKWSNYVGNCLYQQNMFIGYRFVIKSCRQNCWLLEGLSTYCRQKYSPSTKYGFWFWWQFSVGKNS